MVLSTRMLVPDGDKGPTLGQGFVDGQEGCVGSGRRGRVGTLLLSDQFRCGPETALKHQLFKKRGEEGE